MEDLCAFHRERNGKNVTPETFPDAILNGSRLDLYRLYKEVTTRGGIKCVAVSSETHFISHWNVLLMSLFSNVSLAVQHRVFQDLFKSHWNVLRMPFASNVSLGVRHCLFQDQVQGETAAHVVWFTR